MKTFNAYEYLLIDIANQWGLDKKTFEDRIEWTLSQLDQLELIGELRVSWKEKPLYIKAVQALRKVQTGKPTGHLVGLDAICSGMQIMSALTGCEAGAKATGLIDPDRRADAYTDCLTLMKKDVPTLKDSDRKSIKQAVMTTLYGSKAEPKKLFGEGTVELNAFYKALQIMSPGSCELLEDLLSSWQPYALKHSWVLPDNHHVHVKVMETVDTRIEVDELNHATFSYRYQDNVGQKVGLSNVANVIHSIDAYIVRSMVRRCNYNAEILAKSEKILHNVKLAQSGVTKNNSLNVFIERFSATNIIDSTILSHLTVENVKSLSQKHINGLKILIESMKKHKPFEIVTIHDEFKCHPNNLNHLRQHYLNLLCELSKSTVLDDIFSHLYGKKITYQKISSDLSKKITHSNYALS